VKTRAVVRALNEARTNFDRQIEQIAELARDQLVPYFEKRGWSYMAGNGTWYIEDRRGRPIEDHKLPAAVRAVLDLEVEYARPLGFFIRNITRKAVQ
jgi:hypothetical protein